MVMNSSNWLYMRTHKLDIFQVCRAKRIEELHVNLIRWIGSSENNFDFSTEILCIGGELKISVFVTLEKWIKACLMRCNYRCESGFTNTFWTLQETYWSVKNRSVNNCLRKGELIFRLCTSSLARSIIQKSNRKKVGADDSACKS